VLNIDIPDIPRAMAISHCFRLMFVYQPFCSTIFPFSLDIFVAYYVLFVVYYVKVPPKLPTKARQEASATVTSVPPPVPDRQRSRTVESVKQEYLQLSK